MRYSYYKLISNIYSTTFCSSYYRWDGNILEYYDNNSRYLEPYWSPSYIFANPNTVSEEHGKLEQCNNEDMALLFVNLI